MNLPVHSTTTSGIPDNTQDTTHCPDIWSSQPHGSRLVKHSADLHWKSCAHSGARSGHGLIDQNQQVDNPPHHRRHSCCWKMRRSCSHRTKPTRRCHAISPTTGTPCRRPYISRGLSRKFTCLQCIYAEEKCRYKGARDVLEDIVGRPASGDCSDRNEEYNAFIFADINGDGRDDYLHVKISGEVSMYWNTGRAPDEGPNAGKVQWVYIGVIASGGGARGEQVHFADMDGDGRADLVWVKDSGAASVWWNRGFNAGGDVKVVWHGAQSEEIATGIGDGKGVRLADMNGDGRADFLHLAENGAATLYINQGRKADGGGWGWWSWGQVAAGVGTSRNDIRLADMNGDGRADYISVDEETGGLNVWYNRGPESGKWGGVSPLVWWNPGKPIASGVSYLPNWWKSNTVTFGDLNGDGRDEYLYVGADDSSVYAFLNGC